MSFNKRVVWSEGLFLRPQHLQQQDRFLERYIELRSGELRPNAWGFAELELDHDQLATGKLIVRRARGVFPDGTPFCMPDDDPVPSPLDVGANVRNQIAYLGIPARRAGATDFVRRGSSEVSRFEVGEIEARDATSETSLTASLEVGELRSRLLLQGEARDGFACIPLAQILECRADQHVLLEKEFIPTALRCAAAPPLARLLQELQGLLQHRSVELALRAAASGRSGAAEISDFLLLQICNRYEPLFRHWTGTASVHPEDLYIAAVMLEGELATLLAANRRPAVLPAYQHANLRASFDPLIAALRTSLSRPIVANAEPIPLKVQATHGIWHGTIADPTLLQGATFVLGARAQTPEEMIRQYFPAQAKVASVEEIARFIRDQVPGISLLALAQVPRQIPYHAGFVYFQLDPRHPAWKSMQNSRGIAIHVAGTREQWPDLTLELWAIRSNP